MYTLTQLQSLQSTELGITLSGGGVKGMAHLGILKALKVFDIDIHHIAGASAGALVGVFYAQGATIEDMLYFFKETPLFKYNFFAIKKIGLFDTEKYLKILDEHIDSVTFEDLTKPLTVVATDIENGIPRYFNSGELFRPILASAALPPVFSPVSINGTLYSDGGIMDNFPIQTIRDEVKFVFGSYTSTAQIAPKSSLNNSIKLVTRVNNLMLHANVRSKLELCDLLIRPEGLEQIAVLDKKGIDKAFTTGYDTAMKVLSEL